MRTRQITGLFQYSSCVCFYYTFGWVGIFSRFYWQKQLWLHELFGNNLYWLCYVFQFLTAIPKNKQQVHITFMFKEKLGVIVLTSPSLPIRYGLFLGSAKFSSMKCLISSHLISCLVDHCWTDRYNCLAVCSTMITINTRWQCTISSHSHIPCRPTVNIVKLTVMNNV